MEEKFAKLYNSINIMRKKVIDAKGEAVKGLSKPVISKNAITKTRHDKTQGKA